MSLQREDVFADCGYASACSRYRRPTGSVLDRYLKELTGLLARQPSDRHPLVVDAGCGSGGFTLPLARLAHAHGGHLIALDRSPAMLQLLEQRLTRAVEARFVTILKGDFLSVGLPEPCSLIWASDVVHSFRDLDPFVQRAARLLKVNGALAIRMSSHAQLRSYEWGAFFPTALRIDLHSHHDTDVVCEALERGGFDVAYVKEIDESQWMTSRSYITFFESRSLSSLRLIDDSDFAAGMVHMRRACIRRRRVLRNARTTLISAVSRGA